MFVYADPVKVQHPHVWYNPPESRMPPRAALLIAWRQLPLGEWEGQIVICSGTHHAPEEALTLCWVKAECLTPAAR